MLPQIRSLPTLSLALALALLGAALPGKAAPRPEGKPAESAAPADPRLAPDPQASLFAKDASFAWEVSETLPVPGGTMHVLRLTSQTWQGMTWRHWMRVIVPSKRSHAESALLVVGGGKNREPDKEKSPGALRGEAALFLPMIAGETGSIVALLEQVPNQPLFEGLTEDHLIAHTFQKALETKDRSWPALVPMVRSAMRAMDAIQELTAKDGGARVERFFVTGASKRGWTTWLTAAHDARVFAIAPMVIDVVNMAQQMPHQVEMLGKYSEQIDPYVRMGLPQKVQGPEAKELLDVVDPWHHRERLTLPKLVVLGTNDPYWAVDASSLYFDGLPGEKHLSYVPNAGHGLGPQAYETAAAFYGMLLDGTPRPSYRFAATRGKDGLTSARTLQSEVQPASVKLYRAESKTSDFRPSRWAAEPLSPVPPVDEGGAKPFFAGETGNQGGAGWKATYMEAQFKTAKGRTLTVSSTIEVLRPDPSAAPADGAKPAEGARPAKGQPREF